MKKEEFKKLMRTAVDEAVDSLSASEIKEIMDPTNRVYDILGDRVKYTYPSCELVSFAERNRKELTEVISSPEMLKHGALFAVAAYGFEKYENKTDTLLEKFTDSGLGIVAYRSRQGDTPEEIAQLMSLVVEDVEEFVNCLNKEKK